jgi:hypothetical protein
MNEQRTLAKGISTLKPLAACLAVVLATGGSALANRPLETASTLPTAANATAPSRLQAVLEHGLHVVQARKQQKRYLARAQAVMHPNRPAATTPVTSCADDGSAGTLRSIVDAAATGDTIDLSALS